MGWYSISELSEKKHDISRSIILFNLHMSLHAAYIIHFLQHWQFTQHCSFLWVANSGFTVVSCKTIHQLQPAYSMTFIGILGDESNRK